MSPSAFAISCARTVVGVSTWTLWYLSSALTTVLRIFSKGARTSPRDPGLFSVTMTEFIRLSSLRNSRSMRRGVPSGRSCPIVTTRRTRTVARPSLLSPLMSLSASRSSGPPMSRGNGTAETFCAGPRRSKPGKQVTSMPSGRTSKDFPEGRPHPMRNSLSAASTRLRRISSSGAAGPPPHLAPLANQRGCLPVRLPVFEDSLGSGLLSAFFATASSALRALTTPVCTPRPRLAAVYEYGRHGRRGSTHALEPARRPGGSSAPSSSRSHSPSRGHTALPRE